MYNLKTENCRKCLHRYEVFADLRLAGALFAGDSIKMLCKYCGWRDYTCFSQLLPISTVNIVV